MGGRIALGQTWGHPKPYDAAVAFYGNVANQNAEQVAVPVLGLYGARDTGIPAADVRAFFELHKGRELQFPVPHLMQEATDIFSAVLGKGGAKERFAVLVQYDRADGLLIAPPVADAIGDK